MAKAKPEAASEGAATSIDSSAPTDETSSALLPELAPPPVVETESGEPLVVLPVELTAPEATVTNPPAPPPVVSAPPPVTPSKELSMPSDKSTSRSTRGPRIKVHEHGNITWDGLVYLAGKTYELDTEKHSKKDYQQLLEAGTIIDPDKGDRDEVSEPEPVL